LRTAQHLLTQPKVTLLEAQLSDNAGLQQLVAGHDAVINLVARLHGTAAEFEALHVDLPARLAQACRTQGVHRLVHVSALGADARQPDALPSRYLRSKSRGESVLWAASVNQQLQLTVLRPSVLVGADDKFLNVFASLQKLAPLMPLAGADVRFQPVWVEDLAQAIVVCLNNPQTAGATFEVCGPEVLTLRQLVQLAGRCAGINGGKGRPVLGLPLWLGKMQAALMQCAPGEPLMSPDNLDSLRLDNVASGQLPGLQALGITPASVRSLAAAYLRPTTALDTLRSR
jgi:NADH dehydrogenase